MLTSPHYSKIGAYYSRNMLMCSRRLLFPKLCWHIRRRPTVAVNKKFTFRFRCTIVLRCDRLRSVSVLIPFRSIENSLFWFHFHTCQYRCYRFETVERSRKTLSVRVSATVERSLSNCFVRMVYTAHKKQRILHFYSKGYKAPTIQKFLASENLVCSRVGIAKFIKVFLRTGSICRQPGSGRPSKVTREVKDLVEQQMRLDDETTAYQLHQLLTNAGYSISLRTILRCRTSLGWTFRGSAYCQVIREANKQKRLNFARKYRDDTFDNIIWTDECTVQMESHRRFCCHKRGEAPRPKPRFVYHCTRRA